MSTEDISKSPPLAVATPDEPLCGVKNEKVNGHQSPSPSPKASGKKIVLSTLKRGRTFSGG